MGQGLSCGTNQENGLFSAFKTGDIETVEALLKREPSLLYHTTVYDRHSALHIAAANGQIEILDMLLEKFVNPDVVNRHKQTPLMLAAMHGKISCVEKLIEAGANILMFDSLHGRTCLHYAAYYGHFDCLQAILSAAQSSPVAVSWGYARFVNIRDARGATPLHLAARQRRSECVHILLDNGAFVCASTGGYGFPGSTPLHLAARGGSLDCIRKLLAWGADRLQIDASGRIPYVVALKYKHGACAALLNPSSAEPLVCPAKITRDVEAIWFLIRFSTFPEMEKLLQLYDQTKVLASSKSIARCTISCISVLLTQFALVLVPLFFSSSPLFIQLTLSALILLIVLGSGGWCRWVLGFRASAPAFVFFTVFFVWGVYVVVVRKSVMDVVFNGEMIMLVIGLCRIMLKDPGFVAHESFCSDELDENSGFGVQTHNESSRLQMRVRYCKSCKTYIQGFDHHCPALGNCIGQKNYVIFIVLLVGFITTEISYVVCSSQYASKFQVLKEIRMETGSNLVMAGSTLLFCVLQVLWQGLFLIWHVYCICFNIRTEEWVNWKKYPEFQLNASSFTSFPWRQSLLLKCGCKTANRKVRYLVFQDMPLEGQLEGTDYNVRHIWCMAGELHVQDTDPTEGTSFVNVHCCPFDHIKQYGN
ncbi:hypothetical protein HRI_003379000 [Hibiscus trionum]|uniref:S-acyltransferase n=1 Tax=Hibiscus trionum TaxID=183268 RepID=A0A9W7MD29_HIBTR|nr:hypothetical protein HRI_003379000 [Hibiscus trionum]